MNCPGCGNPVEKDAQFCPKCYVRIEPASLWRRFLSLFRASGKPARCIVNIEKTVSIKTTDEDGQKHEYHSLDEAPPELRAEIEKLEAEALKEKGGTVVSQSSDGMTSKIISEKKVSLFKVIDASGNERTYHSLDEMPPEIRGAMEQAEKEESRSGNQIG
jgi:uncharacterized protein YrzB (UPF0473 family)